MVNINTMTTFGHNVDEWRRRKGWTIQRLADESGMDRASVSKIISGKENASITRIERIANALGVDVSALFAKQNETVSSN